MTIWLCLGIIGHILCAACDCLMTYGKKGRIDFKNIKDAQKMSEAFENMPPEFPLVGTVLGVAAIALFGLAYFAVGHWIMTFSEIAGMIMQISAVFYIVAGAAHHVIFGSIEWLYIRLGRTAQAREGLLDLMKKTISTMVICYAGVAVFVITFFIMTVSGNTALPQWACVFNTAPIMLLLLPTKLPAKGNIAGAVMFAGLLFLI